ncbi:MAG: pyridoxal phosphate-dependent aminotransferase [Vulcanimicrobiota bacterium]
MKPSSTLAVTAKFKAMLAEGIDVVGFGAGEPDFDTPEHIKEAAIAAIRAGRTKYEPAPGSPAARQAVARHLGAKMGKELTADNVMISCGGKHSLFTAFQVVLEPGDELLLPSPFWVSYPEQAKLAGGTVKFIPGSVDNDFKITPDQLREAIGPKSRVLLLNSPCNPTGTMYSPAELKALAELALEHNLVIFSDEIYDRLVYGPDPSVSVPSLHPDLFERTLVFNGLSKAYAMTGWRVGFTAGPAPVIKAMAALQGQMTSNIPSFVLDAIPVALEGPQEAVETMRQAFAARGRHIHQRLMTIKGIRCPQPTGAFYVFPDISAYFSRVDPAGRELKTAADFAESLLEHAKVAVVPGEDFEGPDHVRLSFATSMELIDKGIDRVGEYIGGLK